MTNMVQGDNFAPGFYSATISTEDWLGEPGEVLSSLIRAGAVKLIRATGFDGNTKTWLLVQVLRPIEGGGFFTDSEGKQMLEVSGGSWGNSLWFPETSTATAETSIPEVLQEASKPGLIDSLDTLAKNAQGALDNAKSLVVLVSIAALTVALVNALKK